MNPNYTDLQALALATKVQQAAYQPGQSVWVLANAGTGKTTVLTHRLLALLLADPNLKPRELLALTFTRAAAAEMAVRLPALVARWAAKSEAQLQEEIPAVFGVAAPPNAAARLAQLLHGPEGLRLQPPLITTLHGFAQHLLTALPAAAGLPEGFRLLDELAQQRLLRQVQQQLVALLPSALAPYVVTLLEELGEHGWDDLTTLTQRAWWQLELRLGAAGLAGLPALLERLKVGLNLPPAAVLWAPLGPTPDQAAVFQRLGKPCATEGEWCSLLLTKSGTPRASILKKAEAAGLPEALLASLDDAAAQAYAITCARKAWRGWQLTEALLTWGAYVQATYRQAKAAQGVLDFSDLLTALQQVLADAEGGAGGDEPDSRAVSARWLWHSLDRRFRHLAVDEAQDNNAVQGAIVAWLTRQLLAGEVGGAPRTVLAVGDVKQSVYRFQGAQPQEFYALRDTMTALSPAVTLVPLTATFRNGQAVLAAVNATFADPALAAMVQGEPAPWPQHTTVAPMRPCRVELWPLVAAGSPAESAAEDILNAAEEAGAEAALGVSVQHPSGRWWLAEERQRAQQPSAKLRCLAQVADWLVAQQARGVVLPSATDGQGVPRPLAWHDMLILVQKNETARLMAGCLGRLGVPVNAPRGAVPPAVQDVVALLRVVHNQADTVALAQVLKGLEGYYDAQLLALAAQAVDGDWWAALPNTPRGLKGFLQSLPAVRQPVAVVQAAVAWWGLDYTQFTALLAWAEEAAAAPDSLLGALGSLVQRLEEEDLPVAPQPGVRVLTVHSAKGLEAPLVVLADAGEALVDIQRETLLWGEGTVLFKQGEGVSTLEDALIAQTKAARATDSLRALYVGLTRAADWLVVTGWERGKKQANRTEET